MSAVEWTRTMAEVAEKWDWLSAVLDALQAGRVCNERRCLRSSTTVVGVSSARGSFEAGFCDEHMQCALDAGLGVGWKLGAVRRLVEGEVLDGPASMEEGLSP